MDLDHFRRTALALPEVTEEPHHHFSSFRVAKKIFVTLPPGDEFVHVFVAEEDRQRAMALEPAACEALHWGKKVVGLRLAVGKISQDLAEELLRIAWRDKAPKNLPRL